jgi:hypothetical protein
MNQSSLTTFLLGAVLVSLIVAVVVPFAGTVMPRPFGYDEADYVYAGTRGLAANFLDRPCMSLVEFIRVGMDATKERRADAHRDGLSRIVRASGDITFFRHYHGPMYAYWIGVNQLAGTTRPQAYRRSGLIIHAATTLMIFVLFRLLFPGFPGAAALAAATTFLLNRTALVTSTIITQHVLFTLFAVLALGLVGLYGRKRESRYWLLGMATVGLAFATVEIGVVLLGAVTLTFCALSWDLRWKELTGLYLKGLGIALAAFAAVWPMGVLQLNAAKGFGYLAYMAIFRKTFTPIGPQQLWAHKLTVYPLEFVIPLLALVVSGLLWKKLSCRREVLPFLVYAAAFFAVTCVITLPFTYYHESLLATLSVVVGAAWGEIWRRFPKPVGVAAGILLAVTIGGSAWQYYWEARETARQPSLIAAMVDFLDGNAPARSQTLYVPYTLLPTLHYHHPDVKTVGYDETWKAGELAGQLRTPGQAVVCAASICSAIRGYAGTVDLQVRQVSGPGVDEREPSYLLAVATATR